VASCACLRTIEAKEAVKALVVHRELGVAYLSVQLAAGGGRVRHFPARNFALLAPPCITLMLEVLVSLSERSDAQGVPMMPWAFIVSPTTLSTHALNGLSRPELEYPP
jgi:hypothetical protein